MHFTCSLEGEHQLDYSNSGGYEKQIIQLDMSSSTLIARRNGSSVNEFNDLIYHQYAAYMQQYNLYGGVQA